MATSKTEIANMALSHVGTAKAISDLASERSAEANACRQFYDQAREEMLRARWWPFATKLAVSLALVESEPNLEWGYSYRYPADCIEFRRILSGIAHGDDNRQTRAQFRLGQDEQGKLIFTDFSQAQGEYTVDVKDVTRFDPFFVSALSYRLASLIAPRVTAGDPFKLGPMCIELYKMAFGVAAQAAMNEEQIDPQPESEFTRARENLLAIDPYNPSAIVRGNG